MYATIRGTPAERKIVRLVISDVEKIAAGFTRGVQLEVLVGNEHFASTEAEWVGSCVHKSDKTYLIALRPASAGGLYVTALHEVGHALGLRHTADGVMVAAKRQRNLPLTVERRRRWLRNFGTQLLSQALAGLIT